MGCHGSLILAVSYGQLYIEISIVRFSVSDQSKCRVIRYKSLPQEFQVKQNAFPIEPESTGHHHCFLSIFISLDTASSNNGHILHELNKDLLSLKM